MSIVNVTNVIIKNNPAKFLDKYELEITFECIQQLKEEFKLVYVGSSKSYENDQELDSVCVGPVPVGVNKFTFEADPPNLNLLPQDEVVGVTVILLSVLYQDREFMRIGYYVNNEYDTEELNVQPPEQVKFENLLRNILITKPKITRFDIPWDGQEEKMPVVNEEEIDENDIIKDNIFTNNQNQLKETNETSVEEPPLEISDYESESDENAEVDLEEDSGEEDEEDTAEEDEEETLNAMDSEITHSNQMQVD